MRLQRQALGQSWVRHARSRLFVPASAAVTPSFNPADYGADFSWWAARLEAYTNGALVPTWTDRGSGTLTVTGASGQQPVFRTALDPVSPNGNPFIRWTSGNRLLNLTTGITGPWTGAIVCRPTALGSTNIPALGGAPSLGTTSIRFRSSSSGSVALYVGNTPAIQYGPTNPVGAGYQPISPLGWQVIVGTFHFGNTNEGLVLLKSGLTAGTSPNNLISDINTSGSSNNVAAGAFALGGNLFVGEIAEAVVWRQTMDAATRILIGKSLANLYGVTY